VLATDDVDLSIGAGELRCLIGPNGAGKTTLFRLISGEHRVDSGTIELNGHDVTRLQPFARSRLGLALKWQNRGTFTDLTLAENLRIAAHVRRRDPAADERTSAVLRELGVDADLDRVSGDLSHGAQQMLEIAMALAAKPSVLLLDEPAAGLSRDETSRTAAIVRDIANRGVTVVVTEHDMAFVRELQAPVTVLHQGRVFAEGSLGEIEDDAKVREIYLGSAA
jgi:branched-chain amino acid transport system ATP-binding protein